MYNLLIIDDEMATRKDIYNFMFASKFQLECIESDENVLNEILQKKYFDCVIIDNNLDKGLSKEEVFKIIAELRYPIIMVSNVREFTLKEFNKEWFIDCISLSHIFALRDMPDCQEKKDFQEKFIKDLCERVERDIYIYRGYKSDDRDALVICHMSDIQFCDPNANENDLRTLFDKLETFILHLDSSIDLLVITGDIVFSGKKREFAIAKEVIGKFKENMKKHRRDLEILFIPGNHDFDYQAYLLDVDGKYTMEPSFANILSELDDLEALVIKPKHFIDFEGDNNYITNFKNFAYEISKDISYLKRNFHIRIEKFAKSGFAIEGINNAYKFHKNKDGSKRYMFEYSGEFIKNFDVPLYTVMAGHVDPRDLGYKYVCNNQADRCDDNTFRLRCGKSGQCEKWGDMHHILEHSNSIVYLCGHVHYSDTEISDDKKRLFISAAAPTGINPNEKALNIIELDNKGNVIEATVSRYEAKPGSISNISMTKFSYDKLKKEWKELLG